MLYDRECSKLWEGVRVHILLRRIPIAQVNLENEAEASEYLMDMFQQKDEEIEYFEKHGNSMLLCTNYHGNTAICSVSLSQLYLRV